MSEEMRELDRGGKNPRLSLDGFCPLVVGLSCDFRS